MFFNINPKLLILLDYLGSAEKHFSLIQVTDIIYDSL